METFFQDVDSFFYDIGCHLAESPVYTCLHIDAEAASALARMFVGLLTLPFPVVGLPLIGMGIWALVRWSGIFIACQLRREFSGEDVRKLVSLSFTIGRCHGH